MLISYDLHLASGMTLAILLTSPGDLKATWSTPSAAAALSRPLVKAGASMRTASGLTPASRAAANSALLAQTKRSHPRERRARRTAGQAFRLTAGI